MMNDSREDFPAFFMLFFSKTAVGHFAPLPNIP